MTDTGTLLSSPLDWARAILADYQAPDGVRLTAVAGEPDQPFAVLVKLQRPFTGRTRAFTRIVLDDPLGRENVERRLRHAIVEFLAEPWPEADRRWLAAKGA